MDIIENFAQQIDQTHRSIRRNSSPEIINRLLDKLAEQWKFAYAVLSESEAKTLAYRIDELYQIWK